MLITLLGEEPKRTPVDSGALEQSHRSCLLLEGVIPAVLGLQTREARPGPAQQVDERGHAFTLGAIQEVCSHAALSSGQDSTLDQATALQWSRGRNEQQDQIDQPPVFWLS